MYELKKKFGKVLTSKSVGTGPSSYEKRIYRPAVSQRLRNTAVEHSPEGHTCVDMHRKGDSDELIYLQITPYAKSTVD